MPLPAVLLGRKPPPPPFLSPVPRVQGVLPSSKTNRKCKVILAVESWLLLFPVPNFFSPLPSLVSPKSKQPAACRVTLPGPGIHIRMKTLPPPLLYQLHTSSVSLGNPFQTSSKTLPSPPSRIPCPRPPPRSRPPSSPGSRPSARPPISAASPPRPASPPSSPRTPRSWSRGPRATQIASPPAPAATSPPSPPAPPNPFPARPRASTPSSPAAPGPPSPRPAPPAWLPPPSPSSASQLLYCRGRRAGPVCRS